MYHFSLDTIDFVAGRSDALSAPRSMMCVGGGNFKKIGEEFFRYFTELCELSPSARVLDVGCGTGRMAVVLADYLNKGARYEGFDIVPEAISWCQRKLMPLFPNFNFQLADVRNSYYNPRGRYAAHEYEFPYPAASFDFVFLTSVFTHMLPRELERYFSEITRVMKPGANCLITYFLLNDESRRCLAGRLAKQTLPFEMDGYFTSDKDSPEEAVGYDEGFVRGLYKKYGLTIVEPVNRGSWCGREKFLSYQDVVIARKD